ncbi:flagellar biosynthesis protein FlhF [Caminibacter mediatlanticus]|uniref:Flagellar biosynthesis protein FlhF n=1 Tax=Caminibacter mediatlanticus TB-2 TaxID=391592 RepID=A0AAI9AHZ1_9BACT|nr:flagellar biosynthesis protein FlhF [Caminibacter mediatlanticus]EDM23983.1 flagellar biosynthesis regulator FlhF [Caminibacter mediatlanticus TB-2]
MKLKTYTAPTYTEALNKIKSELGDEVVIVSSKELKKKTLTSPGLYEIVVAIEDEKSVNKENSQNKKDEINEVMLKLSNVAKEINNTIKEPVTKTQNSTLNNIKIKKENDEIKELKKEFTKLADTLKFLQATVWDILHKDDLELPPEFSEIYALSRASGMHYKHLDEMMKLVIKYMPIKMRQNRETIRRYFYTLLKKMIPIRLEREIKPPHKKILMFVGPTGVGKTTTIAKLAARYAYKLSTRHKVGIITLDTYRIGAVEQLMTYAKMMKLPIETVVDPNDFEEALNSLRHNDYILIDTVGSSQHDKEKIEKLNSFLKVDSFAEINVNLVLSAVTKYEDLIDIYKNFSILPIDTFVFTKLDETKSYGNVFSLLLDTKKPISYFSIGQEVPDDLIVANADYLINGILNKDLI